MKRFADMNGNEKIAYKNIKFACEWVIGGWVNEIYDGFTESLPSTEAEAKKICYYEAINNSYTRGGCHFGQAPKEMRFAGADFINEAIENIFARDEDIGFIGTEMKWW